MVQLPPGIRRIHPVGTETHKKDHPARHKEWMSHHGLGKSELLFEKRDSRRMLSPLESLSSLIKGNKEHQARLAEFESAGGKLPKKIERLIITCADARMGGMFDFKSFAEQSTVALYVAGNISGILGSTGVKDVLSRMGKGSSITIIGHSKCGAVHCASERHKFASHKNISSLLKSVKGESEVQNLSSQVESLKGSAIFTAKCAKKGVRVLSAFAEISHGAPTVTLHDRLDATGADEAFISRLSQRFGQNAEGQDLSQKQYAHAIVISGASLPFDAREIFSCGANEIFSVSAGDKIGGKVRGKISAESIGAAEMAMVGLLDEKAIGSVEYSVSHNQSSHIVLLHPNLEVAHSWERELLAKSEIVRDAIVSGNVEITVMAYDSGTGRATQMSHLVNEVAPSSSV